MTRLLVDSFLGRVIMGLTWTHGENGGSAKGPSMAGAAAMYLIEFSRSGHLVNLPVRSARTSPRELCFASSKSMYWKGRGGEVANSHPTSHRFPAPLLVFYLS